MSEGACLLELGKVGKSKQNSVITDFQKTFGASAIAQENRLADCYLLSYRQ